MKHYRQIIINVEVDDDLPEEKIDSLVKYMRQLKKIPMRMKLRLIMCG